MIDELKKIGLSENEARVYVALLELGNATAQETSKKSGVNRPTTYVQIENLMKMGLISSFEKDSGRGSTKTFFKAEDPEHLVNVLEKEKKEAALRESVLRAALPELGKIFMSAGERPRVRFFEGMDGLRTMQEEFIKETGREVVEITSYDDVIRLFPQLGKEFKPRRLKKDVHVTMIYTSSQGAILKSSDQEDLRKSYLIPSDQFPVAADLSVSDNIVGFFVLKEKPFGIIIENEHIAGALRSLFNLALDSTKKYNSE